MLSFIIWCLHLSVFIQLPCLYHVVAKETEFGKINFCHECKEVFKLLRENHLGF